MKDKIFKNLLLNVIFERNKSQGGIELPGHTFYLIGSLPALIVYSNGKKEVANLKARERINADDPYLREMVGVKATSKAHKTKYKIQIDKIASALEKSITRALRSHKWQNKPINQLMLVNI